MPGTIVAAYVHFLSIVTLGGILMAELVLYRPDITAGQARRLQRLDLHYLLAAVVALGSGLARALWFGKPTSFYVDNPVFWVKMGMFIAIALLSIPPTIHFLSWTPQLKEGHPPEIAARQYHHIKAHLILETVLLLLMPLPAVLMARGVGT